MANDHLKGNFLANNLERFGSFQKLSRSSDISPDLSVRLLEEQSKEPLDLNSVDLKLNLIMLQH